MQCVALVTDMIFETKIRSTAESLGVTLMTVGTLDELRAALNAEDPSLVIVDLDETGCEPADAVGLAAGHACCPRIVAYGSHVRTDLLQAAEQAGAHEVWPRSKFNMQLPMLLQELRSGA